jgi:hypothetical protein
MGALAGKRVGSPTAVDGILAYRMRRFAKLSGGFDESAM